MPLTVNSMTAEATTDLGKAIGLACTHRIAFLLAGEYGTGKTTFIQGLASGLGITGAVRSPSYNILKIYSNGRLPLVHADLYRTNSTADIDELGIMELLPEDGVLAIEWPGKMAESGTGLPEVRIMFEYLTDIQGQADSGRSLNIETGENCPKAIREVFNATAAR